MGLFGPFHFIILLFIVAAFVWPVALILKTAGYSGWWRLLWFVPIGNIVGLWIFATSTWPIQRQE